MKLRQTRFALTVLVFMLFLALLGRVISMMATGAGSPSGTQRIDAQPNFVQDTREQPIEQHFVFSRYSGEDIEPALYRLSDKGLSALVGFYRKDNRDICCLEIVESTGNRIPLAYLDEAPTEIIFPDKSTITLLGVPYDDGSDNPDEFPHLMRFSLENGTYSQELLTHLSSLEEEYGIGRDVAAELAGIRFTETGAELLFGAGNPENSEFYAGTVEPPYTTVRFDEKAQACIVTIRDASLASPASEAIPEGCPITGASIAKACNDLIITFTYKREIRSYSISAYNENEEHAFISLLLSSESPD